MNVNFNLPIKNLDGTEAGGEPLNKLLATVMAQSNEGVQDPVKFFDWAIRLHNDGDIDLDNSDMELLKNFIKTHKGLTVFAKGSLLKVLSDATLAETTKTTSKAAKNLGTSKD